MEAEDLSIELEKIELKKKKEIEKKQSYKDFKKSMSKLEQQRLKLINNVLKNQ